MTSLSRQKLRAGPNIAWHPTQWRKPCRAEGKPLTRIGKELTAAYERGRKFGLHEALPFQGLADLTPHRGVEREYRVVVQYEVDLIFALDRAYLKSHMVAIQRDSARRAAEKLAAITTYDERLVGKSSLWAPLFNAYHRRLRSRERAEAADDERAAEREATAVDRSLSRIYEELQEVRDWLDDFVRDAEAYAYKRPTLRSDPKPQMPPDSVRVYNSVEDYVQENSARALKDWPRRKDAEGADYGYRWTWRDPDHPWIVTEWRISYIEKLREVYARRLFPADDREYGWMMDRKPISQPVWLLRSSFSLPREDGDEWESAEDRYLTRLQNYVMQRHNSLIAAAQPVSYTHLTLPTIYSV